MARRDETGERTEQPTALRLKEARREGQVARSSDLVATVGLLAAACVLAVLGGPVLAGLTETTAIMLDGAGRPAAGLDELVALLWEGLWPVLAMLATGAAGVMVAVAAASLVQVGMLASSEAVRPDFGRIGLGRGMARLLSGRSLVRGVMACAKVAVVAGLAVWAFRPALPRIASCGARSAEGLAAEAGSLAGDLAMRILPALVGLAVLDWLYQRWRHRRDLMMTPREVREDLRRVEGDPLIRTHRRRLARKRMQGGSDS